MPPEALPPELVLQPVRTGLPQAWRRALVLLAATLAALLVAYASDWAAMAGQWWNASTYNHILLVPPILAWLVLQRWPELQRLAPSGWWPGLILFALAQLVWVVGAFAGFSLLRQAGAVAMVGAAVLALLGPRVGAGLTFPLAYMVFLVPFGDELVPLLQMVTAALTIALVHLSGIPAAIDGVFIQTPAGLFEVAEACSGVKFLIAMIALGVLVGHVCFRQWRRRAAFLAACIVVPVLANGVRAWGTVYVAQFVGAERAGGIDHLIYGWVFFGVVIALVLALGWRFFDRAPGDPLLDADRLLASPALVRLAALRLGDGALIAGLVALVVAGQGWAFAADRLEASLPRQIHLPEVPGWHRADYRPALWWQPRATGADHRLLGRFADGQGNAVDVFVALYAGQSEGREAGGFGEGALVPDSGWAWQGHGPALPDARSERLLGRGEVGRLAITYYRTGPLLTGSNGRLKLANIADRLRLRARPTMTLILSAEDRSGAPATRQVTAFTRAIGPVGPWMDRIAAGR
ncbi:exosortase A [Novosphingobium piscinae]|uniref:Exosortase A n=1 Tax=Novosphingobium piscinae TaxID=1507448 RepID=A0A7X1FZ19_9SPHN|nr:exosortase A [Novosphingobium piscinae]MBC2669593.1 exosortase A [Novosphingobium piscinae]